LEEYYKQKGISEAKEVAINETKAKA